MSLFNSDLGLEKIRKIIFRDGANIHFTGILGAGMLPLARLLSSRRVNISGNDARAATGCHDVPFARIAPIATVADVDLLVYSLAISEENEDITLAKERGIPLVSRAELLGAVGSDYEKRIGIAGSHGKSTTTAMISNIFSSAGRSPTTVSGAELTSGDNLLFGGRGTFIYEACEYKDSFLRTYPTTAVITNVELDHPDYFKSEDQLLSSFISWAEMASDYAVVWNDGSPLIRKLIDKVKGCVTVGECEECNYCVSEIECTPGGASFLLSSGGVELGRLSVGAIGRHNIANAAVAAVASALNGIQMSVIGRALSCFHGIARRCEIIGRINGKPLIYDYAHHPTEIKRTLQTLSEAYGSVCCIFKPHTYTRTAALWADFVSALSIADYSAILDIYPAREAPIPFVTAQNLAKDVGQGCIYLRHAEVVKYCIDLPVGAIVLMGAGDVDDIKHSLCVASDDQR